MDALSKGNYPLLSILVPTRLSWKVATPHTRQSSCDSETVAYAIIIFVQSQN